MQPEVQRVKLTKGRDFFDKDWQYNLHNERQLKITDSISSLNFKTATSRPPQKAYIQDKYILNF